MHTPKGSMDAPLKPVRLGPVDCHVRRDSHGQVYLRLKQTLQDYPRRYTDRLLRWVEERPEQVFLARRPTDPVTGGPVTGAWERLTYRATLAKVRSIAQALLDRRLGPDRPVMILSENDLENQLLALACTHVGIPYVPVTPAYSLLSKDHAKLRFMHEKMQPGLVFASNAKTYGSAVGAVFGQVEFVATVVDGAASDAVTPFADLLATAPSPAVDAAFDALTPDHMAKVMFTSGTTGDPKGVIFTHRMLCSNRQQLVQHMPFLMDEPPVLVDWLPWHHTFGGTNNVGLALYCGGSYFIDPGKPLADAIQPTVDALREVSPTVYFNTPAGFSALLPFLHDDAALRERFFAKLRLIYYGGAVLPAHIWAALDDLAVAHLGERILIVSGLGSTECGPVPATTSWDPRRQPMVGLPVAGVELKLVPVDGKTEMRLKGDCITPGYWKDAERSAAVFDEEGFFCLGDAVSAVDPQRPEQGLRFDGRLAENFKLSSGTWVHSATLRDAVLAAFSPLVTDAVIAGSGQDCVSALVFPAIAACRALDADLPPQASATQVLGSAAVRAAFQSRLEDLAASGSGSAGKVQRIVLEAEPATLDTGELTAKFAISSSAVLRRRAAVVAELYAEPLSPRVLCAPAHHGAAQ